MLKCRRDCDVKGEGKGWGTAVKERIGIKGFNSHFNELLPTAYVAKLNGGIQGLLLLLAKPPPSAQENRNFASYGLEQ